MTPGTVACQAPLSMEFSRKEYWSGLPFPSPGNLPDPGLNMGLLHCRQILYHLSWATREALSRASFRAIQPSTRLPQVCLASHHCFLPSCSLDMGHSLLCSKWLLKISRVKYQVSMLPFPPGILPPKFFNYNGSVVSSNKFWNIILVFPNVFSGKVGIKILITKPCVEMLVIIHSWGIYLAAFHTAKFLFYLQKLSAFLSKHLLLTCIHRLSLSSSFLWLLIFLTPLIFGYLFQENHLQ